jgi:hypothetical protein
MERKARKMNALALVPSITSVGAQNVKTGCHDLRIVKNKSGIAKLESCAQRPRYSFNAFVLIFPRIRVIKVQ